MFEAVGKVCLLSPFFDLFRSFFCGAGKQTEENSRTKSTYEAISTNHNLSEVPNKLTAPKDREGVGRVAGPTIYVCHVRQRLNGIICLVQQEHGKRFVLSEQEWGKPEAE